MILHRQHRLASHKRFATLRANILQIPLALQNGSGLKVSETHFTFSKS